MAAQARAIALVERSQSLLQVFHPLTDLSHLVVSLVPPSHIGGLGDVGHRTHLRCEQSAGLFKFPPQGRRLDLRFSRFLPGGQSPQGLRICRCRCETEPFQANTAAYTSDAGVWADRVCRR